MATAKRSLRTKSFQKYLGQVVRTVLTRLTRGTYRHEDILIRSDSSGAISMLPGLALVVCTLLCNFAVRLEPVLHRLPVVVQKDLHAANAAALFYFVVTHLEMVSVMRKVIF